ncbi:Mucin-associated surface protein (MASP) [Trypanosoma cruzi]|uniref:Mucin-associated surface protein (MASP), putative n=2 Tax=Trypanosoma cruzi TaxID=5693 RepID=Q4CYG0_TRYCC|nr:mucin-associated surface protein (MASP), putative [Trypanosoma cruzi]EAN85310.1 mucin-associated surface protein (MASP), putative [Trypanosoma cruzi]PWV09765.1 Mucin-associated surface protein (MASP) [Trypanosoma cruzi]|eukprot:XP_807161.1 mucin-associated surface protein (MASP) [Trypanosoma cruzi strain CL Brener]
MAMMMTGRVLLVCALCVLWCSAGGGRCGEEIAKDPVGANDAPGNLGEDETEKAEPAALGHGDLGLNPETTKDVSQGGPSEKPLGGTGGGAVENDEGLLSSGRGDEFKSPSPEEEPPETDDPGKRIEEEEVELRQRRNEEKKLENQPQLQVPVAQQEQSALPQPPQSMQQPSPPQEQPRQQKQQPPHEHPADNEQESKKNKNAVFANKTENAQDSDGSTAVTHITFPVLLLLLLVAAAAAVVAA